MQIWDKDLSPVQGYEFSRGFSLVIISWSGGLGMGVMHIDNLGLRKWVGK